MSEESIEFNQKKSHFRKKKFFFLNRNCCHTRRLLNSGARNYAGLDSVKDVALLSTPWKRYNQANQLGSGYYNQSSILLQMKKRDMMLEEFDAFWNEAKKTE